MDGINGIAGITGVVAFGLLALFNLLSGGESQFTVLLLCITFSCLGFLPFNFPKPRVFMGDVGSILLGFVFACFVVLIAKSVLEFICLASFIFPFYADEIITMVVRLKDGENLLKPHRRHLYQLLANEMGINHWKVSIEYGVFQLVAGLSILFMKQYGLAPVITTIILFFSIFIWVNCYVRKKIGNRKQ